MDRYAKGIKNKDLNVLTERNRFVFTLSVNAVNGLYSLIY